MGALLGLQGVRSHYHKCDYHKQYHFRSEPHNNDDGCTSRRRSSRSGRRRSSRARRRWHCRLSGQPYVDYNQYFHDNNDYHEREVCAAERRFPDEGLPRSDDGEHDVRDIHGRPPLRGAV